MREELDEAKRLAVDAGAILLEYYSTSHTVDWKAPGDPVTIADRSASTFIVEHLRRRFPKDGILSEEEPDDRTRLKHSRVWMIDPMDGTREFIEHRGEFAVMIGLAIEGVPVVGAVYQPTTEKLYFGAAGLGSFLQYKDSVTPLHVSTEHVASRMTLAVSRSHRSSRVEQIRQRLGIKEVIASGSVGLKVGLLCEGRAHIYVHAGGRTNIWDTCAPDAILREAGGRMTDISNAPLKYDQPEVRNLNGLVATNGIVHDRVVKVTQSVIIS
ncbi:MAG: 3'(2'),5'-bisphosphate nucleotidase CysQ [Acidobacteria bacterium]|nr:3'(2'),5'-bisphosphate nucleotidase CysQ [Acidobacteriota bacterium]